VEGPRCQRAAQPAQVERKQAEVRNGGSRRERVPPEAEL
jgi:hypothetical protein